MYTALVADGSQLPPVIFTSDPNVPENVEERNDAHVVYVPNLSSTPSNGNNLHFYCHCRRIELYVTRSTEEERFVARHCECKSCKQTTGFEVISWGRVPVQNICDRKTGDAVDFEDTDGSPTVGVRLAAVVFLVGVDWAVVVFWMGGVERTGGGRLLKVHFDFGAFEIALVADCENCFAS